MFQQYTGYGSHSNNNDKAKHINHTKAKQRNTTQISHQFKSQTLLTPTNNKQANNTSFRNQPTHTRTGYITEHIGGTHVKIIKQHTQGIHILAL